MSHALHSAGSFSCLPLQVASVGGIRREGENGVGCSIDRQGMSHAEEVPIEAVVLPIM